MNKIKTYNLFLFLESLTRGIASLFSLVLLYKRGYSFSNILFFLFLLYSIGILVNYISLKFYYKLVLIFSSFIYGISFLYFSYMDNNLISLFIFALLLSFGDYSYHAVRHYLAFIMFKDDDRKPLSIIFITYLGIIISSIIGILLIEKLDIFITSIIIFILSFFSVLPILFFKKIDNKKDNKDLVIIPKGKVIFNILEQFKVIFLELQPLFLYLYVDNSIYYVGIFNIIVNIASLIFIYFFKNKLKIRYFKYYCFILGLIFIFKINIMSEYFLLVLAFFEGIFIKIYDNFSLGNLYSYEGNNISLYLFYEEFIFFFTKSIIILFYLLLNIDFYLIMYINILGIILSGFFLNIKRNT